MFDSSELLEKRTSSKNIWNVHTEGKFQTYALNIFIFLTFCNSMSEILTIKALLQSGMLITY